MPLLAAALLTIGAMALFFAIAAYGGRSDVRRYLIPHWPWVYGLSLGVYFTSWTFYGAVGSAARAGWDYLPIYLGPFLAFTLGMPLLRRMVAMGRQHQSASIADFLSHRYGKSSAIGALVACLALVAAVPYIALQLTSLQDSIAHLAGISFGRGSTLAGLVIAVGLGALVMMFGTRHADNTIRHKGLVLAIAGETLTKLLALVLVGGLALAYLTLPEITEPLTAADGLFATEFDGLRFTVLTLVSFSAILCLPRQFHMMVVESQQTADLNIGRWVMLGALVITACVVPPIALAGGKYLSGSVAPDLYVLALPAHFGAHWMTVLVFLGGIAAATGMVIVATLALTVMVSNDLVNALQLRLYGARRQQLRSAREQIILRRLVVMIIILGAWLFSEGVQNARTLAGLGLLSFAAAAQLAPAMIGGLLWSKGNRAGAIGGISIGGLLWLLLLAMPVYGFDRLAPDIPGVDGYTLGTIISLSANIFIYVGLSLATPNHLMDRLQARQFIGAEMPSVQSRLRVADVQALMVHAIGEDAAKRAVYEYQAEYGPLPKPDAVPPAAFVSFVERRLARVLGAASAGIIMEALQTESGGQLDSFTLLLGEAHRRQRFSHELLESTLHNMLQGVSVVDRDMRMVAWNKAYLDLFNYPEGLVELGRPVSELIAHNARQGLVVTEPGERYVERRVAHYRSGLPHRIERRWHDGRTIAVAGNPMPGGGYVTTYTDVTAAKNTEAELKSIANTLEHKVADRTRELQSAMEELTAAREEAEQATRTKTRFLAAASHDLMQPLNAARLYASALSERVDGPAAELATKIDFAISNADQLIGALLNISKLDAGALTPDVKPFPVQVMLDDLAHEFEIQAEEKGLALTVMPSHLHIHSDRGLLFSVLQNFLSNAIRYTSSGRILAGVKRRGDKALIIVMDSGPGIPEDKQECIFDEFTRLPTSAAHTQGLGLGLSISKRIADLLDVGIHLSSRMGCGTAFAVEVDVHASVSADITPDSVEQMPDPEGLPTDLAGLKVWCVDDDPAILDAEKTLLEGWGCEVIQAASLSAVRALLDITCARPDILLLDFHIGSGHTGADALRLIEAKFKISIPTIFISADQLLVPVDGTLLLKKPIRPKALRAAINMVLLNQQTAAQ